MNRWECQHPECNRQVTGCGGAIGLRAIGWYFKPGPIIFCPIHRPDPIKCKDSTDEKPFLCSQCQGDEEAKRLQELIDSHGVT